MVECGLGPREQAVPELSAPKSNILIWIMAQGEDSEHIMRTDHLLNRQRVCYIPNTSDTIDMLYKFLTVLFWLSLMFGLIPLIQTGQYYTTGAQWLGNLVAYAMIPGIIWLIRYAVGKQREKQ